jgi:hypothetical protein
MKKNDMPPKADYGIDAPAAGSVWRCGLLAATALASLAVILTLHPISQDLRYHDFADKRVFFGVPNFLDVASNLPFLFVGLSGIRLAFRRRWAGFSAAWFVFFIGVALVCIGSAYYHWQPRNDTLLWDRLPMAVGFMAMLSALLGETIDRRLERILLGPALVAGIASVIYWHLFDDLRFYAWVQFASMLIVLALMALFHSRYTHRWFLLGALACYALAKVFEACDRGVFTLSHGAVAGHAIKHLFAAAGCLFVLEMLKRRKAIE